MKISIVLNKSGPCTPVFFCLPLALSFPLLQTWPHLLNKLKLLYFNFQNKNSIKLYTRLKVLFSLPDLTTVINEKAIYLLSPPGVVLYSCDCSHSGVSASCLSHKAVGSGLRSPQTAALCTQTLKNIKSGNKPKSAILANSCLLRKNYSKLVQAQKNGFS